MEAKDLYQTKKYFNLYRGIVVNNDDPKKGGRVQVRIFELHGMPENCTPGNYPVSSGDKDTKYNQVVESDLPWAEVMREISYIGFYPAPSDGKNSYADSINGNSSKSPYKTITRSGKHSGMGQNTIIAVGTWVFCVLENGNPNYPIVIGAVSADNEMHPNSGPKNLRIYDSITGHYEEWGDDSGRIVFHHRSGTEIIMDKDGNLSINTTNIKKEYIQSDSLLHIDGSHTEYVSNDVTQTWNSNHKLKVASNQNVDVGSNQSVHAGGNITINSDGKIYLN